MQIQNKGGRPEPEENPSAWGWPVMPDWAESQPQQPAQFNTPQVTRQIFWLAMSLRWSSTQPRSTRADSLCH